MINVNTNGDYAINLNTDTRWVRISYKGDVIDAIRMPLNIDILSFRLRYRHGNNLMEMSVSPDTLNNLTATIRHITDTRSFPGITILTSPTTLELVEVLVN